jgi:hypothetical protein
MWGGSIDCPPPRWMRLIIKLGYISSKLRLILPRN